MIHGAGARREVTEFTDFVQGFTSGYGGGTQPAFSGSGSDPEPPTLDRRATVTSVG